MRLERRGDRQRMIMPDGASVPQGKPARDEMLIKALVNSHRPGRKVESDQARSISDLAEQEGATAAYLAPAIVQTALDGRQPRG